MVCISNTRIAAAIVAAANEQGLKLSKPEQFDSESGIGVRGNVDDKTLALGNRALMEQLSVWPVCVW